MRSASMRQNVPGLVLHDQKETSTITTIIMLFLCLNYYIITTLNTIYL